MSATRDQTQKVTFVYSNLYQLYKQGKDKEAVTSSSPAVAIRAPQAAQVLKARDLNAQTAQASPAVKVSEFSPTEFIGKRIPKPEVLVRAENNTALDSLKSNLNQLNELHSRLRFMLKELEELTKE